MEEEKKKVSEAHKRASRKWDKNNYFMRMIRFPAAMESDIRRAADLVTDGSVNGFVVRAVSEAVEKAFSGESEAK